MSEAVEFDVPEYITVGQKSITLTYDGKDFTIKKPSAMKLVDIKEAADKIDVETQIRELIQFQIDVLVDLGLEKPVAEALDISTLKNTFASLSKDVSKKK